MSFTLTTTEASVVIDGSRIGHPAVRTDSVVEAGEAWLVPGLINAHDHLYLNHYPRLGTPPYRNGYEWAADVETNFADDVRRFSDLPRHDALLFGALKNLLGGVTAVVHHDRWLEDWNDDLPLRRVPIVAAHSLQLERNWRAVLHARRHRKERSFCIHLGEGTDRVAAQEVREGARRGLLDQRLLAVHAVAVDVESIELLRAAGAGVIWCPTSNEHLYHRTAPPELFQSGLDVLLGTDSLLSAEGTMLDELRAARGYGYLDDARLLDAVGRVAAARLGLPAPELIPGRPADLVLMRRPILEARPADISLVLVGGKPRYGDAQFRGLFASAGVRYEPLEVGGAPKVVSAPLARIAETVAALSPDSARILR